MENNITVLALRNSSNFETGQPLLLPALFKFNYRLLNEWFELQLCVCAFEMDDTERLLVAVCGGQEFAPFHSFSSFLECCEIGSFDPLRECTLIHSNSYITLEDIMRSTSHKPIFINTWDIFERQKWASIGPDRLNRLARASFRLSASSITCVSSTTRKRSREEEECTQEGELKKLILDQIESYETMAQLVVDADFKGYSADPARVIQDYAAKSARPTFLEAILVGISLEQLLHAKQFPDVAAVYAFCDKENMLQFLDPSSKKMKNRSQSWLRERHSCYRTVKQYPKLLFYDGSIRRFARQDFAIRQMIQSSDTLHRWQDHSNVCVSMEYITKAIQLARTSDNV